jgi:hypothetical protein
MRSPLGVNGFFVWGGAPSADDAVALALFNVHDVQGASPGRGADGDEASGCTASTKKTASGSVMTVAAS